MENLWEKILWAIRNQPTEEELRRENIQREKDAREKERFYEQNYVNIGDVIPGVPMYVDPIYSDFF